MRLLGRPVRKDPSPVRCHVWPTGDVLTELRFACASTLCVSEKAGSDMVDLEIVVGHKRESEKRRSEGAHRMSGDACKRIAAQIAISPEKAISNSCIASTRTSSNHLYNKRCKSASTASDASNAECQRQATVAGRRRRTQAGCAAAQGQLASPQG